MLFDLQYRTKLRLEHMPPGQQALTQNSITGKEIYHEIIVTTNSDFSTK